MPRSKSKGKSDKTDVPDTIERSGKHAKDIWLKAHDSAVKTYGEGGAAHRVAFAALKHVYEKKGDRWVKKAEKGPSDPQARRGPTTSPKSTDEPKAPTARGKVAKTAKQAREKAKEAQREDREARAKRASKSKSSGRKAASKTASKKKPAAKKSAAKKPSARKKSSR